MDHDPLLEALFPNLNPHNYKITSGKTVEYNCIAWAGGDTTQWWEPPPPPPFLRIGPYNRIFFWPNSIPQENSMAAYTELYALQGYEICADGQLEPGFEKIALYVHRYNHDYVLHAARQLTNGRWTSKLGELQDIEHDAPELLDGPDPPTQHDYGSVIGYLKRPIQNI